MTLGDLLADAFGRVRDVVHDAVDGLTADQLAFRPDERANSIAWLVWHLTRIQDDHVADVAGTEQVWTRRAGLGGPVRAAVRGRRPPGTGTAPRRSPRSRSVRPSC